MRLVLVTIPAAVLIGYLGGGRIGHLTSLTVRRPWLALTGILPQLAPVSGAAGLALLLLSFASLLAFALMNLRLAGFPLILLGLTLNFAVIAANQGMPVTRHALVASGQGETLRSLATEGGAKHHLATDDDVLLPLADVIPIGSPINRAVSVGDVATHLGAVWFVAAAMRRPPAPGPGRVPGDLLASG